MAVENTTNIAGLDDTLPTGTDTKSEGDNHLRLLKTVLKHVFAGFPGEVLLAATEAQGATVNDYVLTVAPAPTAYATNTVVVFRANHANTGAATIKVGALAAKALLNPEGTALRANAITATTWALAIYDGTNFRMIGGGNSQAIYDYANQLAFQAALPEQAGNGGRFLRTDGAAAAWEDALPVVAPGSVPAADEGPVYVPVVGGMNWKGSRYASDYSEGFGSGAYSNRNKIINGCFRVWQRSFGFGPLTSASGNPYTADRWRIFLAGTASATVTRETAGSDFGQGRVGGFSAKITSNAAATPGVSDKNRFSQAIEGQDLLSLALGSLWGGSFTLGFWVKASVAGVYSVAFMNGGTPGFRSYIDNYTVNAANAWEFKTVTVPVDQSGLANWDRATGIGLNVVFDLGSGTGSDGAAGTWLSTESTRTTGSVRLVATNAATWEISKVQLEFGTQSTPFEDRPIEKELKSCQRYYEKSYPQANFPGGLGGGAHQSMIATGFLLSGPTVYFKVTKRGTPTISVYSPQSGGGALIAEFNVAGTYVSDRPAGASNIGTTGYALGGTGGMTAGNYITAHWVADAEL